MQQRAGSPALWLKYHDNHKCGLLMARNALPLHRWSSHISGCPAQSGAPTWTKPKSWVSTERS